MTCMQIDARGCACPQPVIKVKKALEKKPQKIEILVDNQIAVQNIKRFAASKNCNFSFSPVEDDFKITVTP